MKKNKALLIGISRKAHLTKKTSKQLKKESITFDFFKWGNLSFDSFNILNKGKKIELGNYQAALFDIPSYWILKNKKKKIPMKLTNEMYRVAKILKDNEVPIVNKKVLLECPFYDKFNQAYIFSKNKIPAIPTLHLSDNKTEKVIKALKKARFSYPIVIKESFGGMGTSVYKIENQEKMSHFLRNKRNKNLIYQPFIENDGDYRSLVCNGSALGIIKRKARAGEWRNNVALGGTAERYEELKMKSFAEKICEKIGFDFAGVDIIKKKRAYLVVEINMFPCFEGFERAFPEISVAEKLIEMLKRLK